MAKKLEIGNLIWLTKSARLYGEPIVPPSGVESGAPLVIGPAHLVNPEISFADWIVEELLDGVEQCGPRSRWDFVAVAVVRTVDLEAVLDAGGRPNADVGPCVCVVFEGFEGGLSVALDRGDFGLVALGHIRWVVVG